MNSPIINVTPLIDVLLVLLIVFMVVAPIRPNTFKIKIPAEDRRDSNIGPHPDTLAVIIRPNGTIDLNGEKSLATVNATTNLLHRLKEVFAARLANSTRSTTFADAPDRPFSDRIERTVFIKAPRSMDYGTVARVVDSVKQAGAFPISLQIDALD